VQLTSPNKGRRASRDFSESKELLFCAAPKPKA